MPRKGHDWTRGHYGPPVPPGTHISSAAYKAAKKRKDAKGTATDNRAERRAARRAARRNPTQPSLPQQEETTVTATVLTDADYTDYEADQPDPAEYQPTPPDRQKPGARYCDGYEVVLAEPALTDAIGSDGHRAPHNGMNELLLIDGRTVYACTRCNHWSPQREDVKAHLRTHNTARATADADYLLDYLKRHGFDEGPFTAKQVWDGGVSRSRFPNSVDVTHSLGVLASRGEVVGLPGIVATYALASSKRAEEAAETARNAWLEVIHGDPRVNARDLQLAHAYAAAADETGVATATMTALSKASGIPKGSLSAMKDRLIAAGYLELVGRAHVRAVISYRLTFPASATVNEEPPSQAGHGIAARAADNGAATRPLTPGPVAGLVADAPTEPDEPTSPADEHPAAEADEADEGGDTGNMQAPPAPAPSPAQVAAAPVDVMSLPLSAILTRMKDVESYRRAAAHADAKVQAAHEAQRAAEQRARAAEAEARKHFDRAEAAEERAKTAEAALAQVRAALGVASLAA